jgi:hypothetical protein
MDETQAAVLQHRMDHRRLPEVILDQTVLEAPEEHLWHSEHKETDAESASALEKADIRRATLRRLDVLLEELTSEYRHGVEKSLDLYKEIICPAHRLPVDFIAESGTVEAWAQFMAFADRVLARSRNAPLFIQFLPGNIDFALDAHNARTANPHIFDALIGSANRWKRVSTDVGCIAVLQEIGIMPALLPSIHIVHLNLSDRDPPWATPATTALSPTRCTSETQKPPAL